MYIETRRLIVRTFREEDSAALYRIKTDPQVTEYCPDLLDVKVDESDVVRYIRKFIGYEERCDIESWRCYAIELKESGEVVGCLTSSMDKMLHEPELGWMMIGEHTKNGYASEAAEAFAEYYCRATGCDYMIVIMDTDNPASRRTAEKSGFRLFEKRTVYDYHYNRYCDDYYYFRRYSSLCTLTERFYGDKPYEGRSTNKDGVKS